MASAIANKSALRTALVGKTVAPKAVRAQAPTQIVAAAARPSWCPGAELPAHLDGSLPGDYGFDPLNLGKDPKDLAFYIQAELIHARFAMAAVAGILIPGILTNAGVLSVPAWYDAGKVAVENSEYSYGALVGAQVIMMGFAEGKRWMDFRVPGSQGEEGSFLGFEGALKGSDDVGYPGGVFDPLGLSKGNLKDMQTKEIKNGRLAMMAMAGFYGQYAATGKGPIENWAAHVADPFNVNFATNGVSVPGL